MNKSFLAQIMDTKTSCHKPRQIRPCKEAISWHQQAAEPAESKSNDIDDQPIGQKENDIVAINQYAHGQNGVNGHGQSQEQSLLMKARMDSLESTVASMLSAMKTMANRDELAMPQQTTKGTESKLDTMQRHITSMDSKLREVQQRAG